jgi:site-specific DNA-methyltransferase (adenine-specific)
MGGQLLELNRIYNMDCMEAMAQFPDKYFELAIVDPPYRNMSENQPTKDMRNNGTMERFGNKPKPEYFQELHRVSKEQIIWGANNFQLPPFKGFVVWKKKTIGETFTMSMCEIASLSDGLSTTSKWIELAPQDRFRIHPTQKPVALYKWLLKNYAKTCDKILDTHMGSGSSVVACYDMGFDYMAFEIDKDYFDSANERIEAHKAQGRLFVDEPKTEAVQETIDIY